jgi:NADH-quinone oxidoreductase subunit J
MMVTVIFVLLSILAVAGAAGILCCRRISYCGLSFLLCGTAVAGLYMLLNMQFLAALQIVLSVALSSTVVVICQAALISVNASESSHFRRLLWCAPLGLLFIALGLWGIGGASIGVPTTNSAPMWAARGEHVPSLGKELVSRYSALFTLAGLLMLVGIVTAGFCIRQVQAEEADL